MSIPVSTLTNSNTINQIMYNVNTIKDLAANSAGFVANTVFQSALANTNSYIATKVSTSTFNSALANTNSYIATVSATERAALANTNSYIATKVNTSTFNSALANTNTYIEGVIANTVSKTSASEQTIQSSVVIANTFVAEKGVPVRITGGNNVTLALTDNGKLIRCVNSTSAMNIHIPTNATVAFPLGAEIAFVNELTSATANTLGFSKAAGVTLYSKANANTIADRYTAASLKKLDTNIWLLIGNIS